MPLQDGHDVGQLLYLENFHRIQFSTQMVLYGRDYADMCEAVPCLGGIHRRIVGQRIGPYFFLPCACLRRPDRVATGVIASRSMRNSIRLGRSAANARSKAGAKSSVFSTTSPLAP